MLRTPGLGMEARAGSRRLPDDGPGGIPGPKPKWSEEIVSIAEKIEGVLTHLRAAEAGMLALQETEKDGSTLSALHDCKIAIWRAMDKVADYEAAGRN